MGFKWFVGNTFQTIGTLGVLGMPLHDAFVSGATPATIIIIKREITVKHV